MSWLEYLGPQSSFSTAAWRGFFLHLVAYIPGRAERCTFIPRRGLDKHAVESRVPLHMRNPPRVQKQAPRQAQGFRARLLSVPLRHLSGDRAACLLDARGKLFSQGLRNRRARRTRLGGFPNGRVHSNGTVEFRRERDVPGEACVEIASGKTRQFPRRAAQHFQKKSLKRGIAFEAQPLCFMFVRVGREADQVRDLRKNPCRRMRKRNRF